MRPMDEAHVYTTCRAEWIDYQGYPRVAPHQFTSLHSAVGILLVLCFPLYAFLLMNVARKSMILVLHHWTRCSEVGYESQEKALND